MFLLQWVLRLVSLGICHFISFKKLLLTPVISNMEDRYVRRGESCITFSSLLELHRPESWGGGAGVEVGRKPKSRRED